MTTSYDVPVLIVGAGPVGLLGAQLLGVRGVRALVVDKYAQRLDAPKAHALNPRSLEICAAAGLPMADIQTAATPTEQGRWVRLVATLAGPELGALPYERQDDGVREFTPWPLVNIAQPRFEAIVERSVSTLPTVELRRGVEWIRCDQLADVVISTLRERSTGREYTVRSRYLIGADGAGSVVRGNVGIRMDGPEALQHQMMIHFEADLRPLVGQRPAILYFLFGPGRRGVFIAYDIARTWVLMYPYDPQRTPPEAFSEAACRDIVRGEIGAEVAGLVIKGARPWAMSAQVARCYRSGNAFVVGDAAHRFPPTGGLGLNTGIADVDNLAWKIAAVEAGWAAPEILDSYERERRIVAQTNTGQSLANALRMRAVVQALGPVEGLDDAGFAARLADPATRARLDAAVEFQRDHFDSLRLQLGYAYGDAPSADAALPVSRFVPKAVVGARLPHVACGARSTLDLVARDRVTVIAGPNDAAWRSLATRAPVVVVAEGRDFAECDWSARMAIDRSGAIAVRPDGHVLAVALDANDAADVAHAIDAYVTGASGQDARAALASSQARAAVHI